MTVLIMLLFQSVSVLGSSEQDVFKRPSTSGQSTHPPPRSVHLWIVTSDFSFHSDASHVALHQRGVVSATHSR